MNKVEERAASLTEKEQDVMRSVRLSRVFLPTLLGLGVVIFFLWKSLKKEELPSVDWTTATITWIVICVLLLACRHFAYMVRLRILTDGFFSWKKCFELIFIWEFSSAVTPTSVGGSAVAMFVLSQEKLPAGKIATLILYAIVLDTLFFVAGLPILLLLIGPEMMSPGGPENVDFVFWRRTFWLAYGAMIIYGSLFFLGIFFAPDKINRFLNWLTSFRLLKRFRNGANKIGSDIVLTSHEIRNKGKAFHLGAFGATAAAWSIRFILVMCLMIAFVPAVREGISLAQQSLIYGRLEVMYIVLALSPTPGGSGIAEAAFGPFLSDLIVGKEGQYLVGMSIIIAFCWRILTYYFYLFAGALVIPNWINKLLRDRVKETQEIVANEHKQPE